MPTLSLFSHENRIHHFIVAWADADVTGFIEKKTRLVGYPLFVFTVRRLTPRSCFFRCHLDRDGPSDNAFVVATQCVRYHDKTLFCRVLLLLGFSTDAAVHTRQTLSRYA